MTKLKEKSEFNIKAAELLIEETYYASSVHCSYYSCFQLLKFVIKDFFKVDYETLSTNISLSSKSSHQYIIDFIAGEIMNLSNRVESRKFKHNINDLKHYRLESDYENIEVNIEKGKKALSKAQEIRTYIKSKF